MVSKQIQLGDNEVIIHVRGQDTGGAYSLVEYVAAPGGVAPRPHRHPFAESFYVLEGVLNGQLEGQPFDVSAGEAIHISGGMAHAWRNTGSAPVRMLIVCAPAGFEQYFEELAETVADLPPGPPAMEKVRTIMARLWKKYGLEPVGDTGT